MTSIIRIYLSVFVIVLFCTACKKKSKDPDPLTSLETQLAEPKACFTASELLIEPGDTVQFQNCSDNVDKTSWDLGDGTLYDGYNLKHVFTTKGIYEVKLTASHGDKTDQVTQTIKCGMKASVTITLNTSEWNIALLPQNKHNAIFMNVELFKDSVSTPALSTLYYKAYLLKDHDNHKNIVASVELPDKNLKYRIKTRLFYLYMENGPNGEDFVRTGNIINLSTKDINILKPQIKTSDFVKNQYCLLDYQLSEIQFH